jgi:hypothetical protein
MTISISGLPDGMVIKYQFGYILEVLRIENIGIFYGPVVKF